MGRKFGLMNNFHSSIPIHHGINLKKIKRTNAEKPKKVRENFKNRKITKTSFTYSIPTISAIEHKNKLKAC